MIRVINDELDLNKVLLKNKKRPGKPGFFIKLEHAKRFSEIYCPKQSF
jgi:hypothetical protein